MKLWSLRDERQFLSQFDAFWETLKFIEGSHRYLSLNPRDRYWIDTYPPMSIWMDNQNRVEPGLEPDLETIARECRGDLFSLYFHFGFCRRRCAYCRQYEVALVGDPASDIIRRYVDLLMKDIDISTDLLPALKTQTRAVYFGGGTPSMIPARILGPFLDHLLRRIDLSVLSSESTYEISPEDEVSEVLELLKAVEVPRISIGVQSFDERILRLVGRRYPKDRVFKVIEQAAKHGFKTINLDLINGFPLHREFGNWKREIESLRYLFESDAIQSATIYMLHPFPKTNLSCEPDDAYWQTRNICFAREYLCGRLQLQERPVYWFQKERMETEELSAPSFSIFGYGNSSYSTLGRWLLQNEPGLDWYMDHRRGNRTGTSLPFKNVFHLTPDQMRIRSILFAMRNGSFRMGPDEAFKPALDDFVRDGLMRHSDGVYQLTESGKIFAHQLPYRFFDPEISLNLQTYLEKRWRTT